MLLLLLAPLGLYVAAAGSLILAFGELFVAHATCPRHVAAGLVMQTALFVLRCAVQQFTLLLFQETSWWQAALAQVGSKPKGAKMVERVEGDSSAEYLDARAESDEEALAAGGVGEVTGYDGGSSSRVTEERLVFDHLGQRVHEPDGPPPGYHARPGPHSGPPPPQPLSAVREISHAVSIAVGRAMELDVQDQPGLVVAHIPPFWRTMRRVAIHVRPFAPTDWTHPHVLEIGDDPSPTMALDTTGSPTTTGHAATAEDADLGPATTTMPATTVAGPAAEAMPPPMAGMLPESREERRARWSRLSEEAVADEMLNMELGALVSSLEEPMDEATLNDVAADMLLNPVPDPAMASSTSSGSRTSPRTDSTHVSGTPAGVNRKCVPYSQCPVQAAIVHLTCSHDSAGGTGCSGEDIMKGHRLHCLQILLVHRGFGLHLTTIMLYKEHWNAGLPYTSWCTVPSCSCLGLAVLDYGRRAQRASSTAPVPMIQNSVCEDDQIADTSCACTFFCMSWLARYCCSKLLHTRWVTLKWTQLVIATIQHIVCGRFNDTGPHHWWHKTKALLSTFLMHPSCLLPRSKFDRSGPSRPDCEGPDSGDPQRSCLGPKSQDCCRPVRYSMHPVRPYLMWCLYFCLLNYGITISEAAIDARVGFADHRSNPGATPHSTLSSEWAKQGENRHIARPSLQPSLRETVRKRALLRAINRADRNPNGQTWYKGRLLHRTQLGPRSWGSNTAGPRHDSSTERRQRRLRLISWNAGGLMDTRNQEVLAWLDAEAKAGRPVDVLTLQETCWKQDLEYKTSCGAGEQAYHVIHSAGPEKSGIMIMIRQHLLPAHDIQYVPLVPGRAVHLRLKFSPPVDMLFLYQVSWNLSKSSLEGHKATALLKQRAKIWRHVEQWLRATPSRHGCVIAGDLNTPLIPEPGICGPVALEQHIAQQDQAELQEILRTYGCCALNSWTGSAAQARTYIPPRGVGDQHGTRIDFVIARGSMIDGEAKKARVIHAPFVPEQGARHRPIQAMLCLPKVPRPTTTQASRQRPALISKQLQNPEVGTCLEEQLQPLLDNANIQENLDDVLLEGWARVQRVLPSLSTKQEPVNPQGRAQHLTVRQQILHMWQLRATIRRLQPDESLDPPAPSLATLWKAWRQVARLQTCTRQLRKDCRRHKTVKVLEAVQADNIYAASKRFAPKQPRRRLQLRTKEGHLLSHEQEFLRIRDYFSSLYTGPSLPPITLTQSVSFEEAEVQLAMSRLAAGKAMPQHSAPAALWRKCSTQVASHLCRQLNACLVKGSHSLPLNWSISDMALIPKPGKAMTSPEQLRPISLLPMPAKALGAMLAERLHAQAAVYLQDVPQFAYMKGRHLGMALDRVASHCVNTRKLLHDQANTLHARRSGHRLSKVSGGCMFSLDLTKAYDHVPWGDLRLALEDAAVPTGIVELVLLMHQQARIRIAHHDHSELLCMSRGLRQGCSLAPALWTIYCGWLLKQLHATGEVDVPSCNTSYADDLLFSWQVFCAADMEKIYRAMRTVLQVLEDRQVQVSIDKTVAIIELQGSGATRCLDRYLVHRPGHEGR